MDEIFVYALTYLQTEYPNRLENRYGIHLDLEQEDWITAFCQQFATKRNIKLIRGELDYDRIIMVVLQDIWDGKLGEISWEKPA